MGTSLLRAILLIGSITAGPASYAQESRVFGDWEEICTDTKCVLAQETQRPNSDDVILSSTFNVERKTDTVIMRVNVPRQVDLRQGPWLTIDGLFVAQMSYVNCENSCLSVVLFDRSSIDGLLVGDRGMITVIGTSGTRLGLPFSLKGLRDGLIAQLRTDDERQ